MKVQPVLLKLRGFYLVTGLGNGLFFPYLSLLLVHDGLDSSQVGAVMSVGTLVAIIAQPLWGIVADRYRLTRSILFTSAMAPALLAYLYNSRWILVLAIVSAASALFSTPQTPIADSYTMSATKRVFASYGSVRCFGSLGYAAGGYIGGLYLEHSPIVALWLPYAVLGVLSAAISIAFPVRNVGISPGGSVFTGLHKLIVNRRFILFLAGGFLVSETLSSFTTYFVLTFQAAGGSLSIAGIAFLIASGTNVPAMLVAARVIARIGRERTMLLAALAYMIRWGVQAFVLNPAVAIGIQVLHGISFGFFYVAAVDYVASTADRETQATGQSVFGMVCGGLAGIFGNLVNGYLLHIGGATLMYGTCMVSALLGAGCFWLLLRTSPRAASRRASTPQ